MSRYLERCETIVIDYGVGKQRWIGSWRQFRISNPTSEVHNVETLEDYKTRMKPKNDASNRV